MTFDVAYEWQAEAVKLELDKVCDVPVLLSTIDRSAALDKGKQRSGETVAPASPLRGCCGGGDVAAPACGCQVTRPVLSDQPVPVKAASGSRRRLPLPPDLSMKDVALLYLGEESLGLTNLLMTNPSTPVRSIALQDPSCGLLKLHHRSYPIRRDPGPPALRAGARTACSCVVTL